LISRQLSLPASFQSVWRKSAAKDDSYAWRLFLGLPAYLLAGTSDKVMPEVPND
jgi:hypothetical protein